MFITHNNNNNNNNNNIEDAHASEPLREESRAQSACDAPPLDLLPLVGEEGLRARFV